MNTDYLDGRRERLLIPNEAEAAAKLREKADEIGQIESLHFFRLSEEQEAVRNAVLGEGNRHERRRQAAIERGKK